MTKIAACLVVVFVALLPRIAVAKSESVSIDVGSRTINGTVLLPKDAMRAAPGILVLHTAGGVERDDLMYAEALANEGYVTLVVHYLNPGLGSARQHPTYVSELSRTVDYLSERPEVSGKPIGIVGFSLGSKGVSVAGINGKVKAVVSYYGLYDLRIFPRWPADRPRPPMPVDFAGKINAAVLLLHGALDNETLLNQAESMRDALVKEGKLVELVVYPQAYHRFDRGAPSGWSGSRSREGFIYQLDRNAERDAWKRTVEWFRKYLTE